MSGSLANYEEVVATVAATQSLSDVVQTNGRTPLWISTPAGLTGTVLTFVAVGAGGDEVLRDEDGQELTLTIGTAGSRHSLLPRLAVRLSGHPQIKVRCGTLGSPSPQAGGAVFRLALRGVL